MVQYKIININRIGGGVDTRSFKAEKAFDKTQRFSQKNKNTPQSKNKREFLQLEKGHVCETANIILNGEKLNKYYFLKIRNEMKVSALTAST